MKLGVSFNLYDGEELLESSASNIRPVADHISVIYQDVSNFGNARESVLPLLNNLKERGIIDQIIKYVPTSTGKGHGNELTKRNIGLEMAALEKCTHFATMDVDEFYKIDEFERVKQIIEEDDYDSSACQMQTYYKTAEYALDPPETYYVPLIYKVDARRFNMNVRWPISADPTRRMEAKKLITFTRNVIEMHHYSMVRKDIRAKLCNSSASPNFKNRIDEIASHFENWKEGTTALMPGLERRLYDVKKTDNHFNIKL